MISENYFKYNYLFRNFPKNTVNNIIRTNPLNNKYVSVIT